jgi:hypothetical protein
MSEPPRRTGEREVAGTKASGDAAKTSAPKVASGARATGQALRAGADRAQPLVERGAAYLRKHPEVIDRGTEQLARRAGRYAPLIRNAGRLARGWLDRSRAADPRRDR